MKVLVLGLNSRFMGIRFNANNNEVDILAVLNVRCGSMGLSSLVPPHSRPL